MYFRYFPLINYNNKLTRNVLLKAKVIEEVFSKYDVFYPYVIQDGELPDIIAYTQYGDSELDWIIYLCNDITDPYYDWPLTENDFNLYMQMKYDMPVVQTKGVIDHYRYTGLGGSETQSEIDRKNWKMSPQTYALSSIEEKSGWTPVYLYDYEYALNEEKRNINLLNTAYIPQLKSEMANIFA